MIKFTAELTIKRIEEKSVRKRDGDMFNFTEVTMEQGGKRPTLLVARADDAILPELQEGLKANFDLGITSFTTQDGRTFNNFLITDMAVGVAKKQNIANTPAGYPDTAADMGDDIPF